MKGSSPISQIVPIQATAMNARLPACLVETTSATPNQNGFVPDCGESKEGCTPATGWIEEIKKV